MCEPSSHTSRDGRDTLRYMETEKELRELARLRKTFEAGRAEVMTRTARAIANGREKNVPVSHMAEWADLARKNVYALLEREETR